MNLKFWKKKDVDPNKKKKSVLREWLDAGVFALVAATIIRTFFIEAYTIPTGSMEGTMLVNDYLFVSKMSYGPRIPMTPLSFPLVHNTMPITGGKSYTESVQWKYRRLPGFGDVELYDVFVFNFPNNDTVMLDAPDRDYYQEVRMNGWDYVHKTKQLITRPVDKRENYIKRCMGLPGNKIQIIDGNVFINDQPARVFNHQMITYFVKTEGNFTVTQDFATKYFIRTAEHIPASTEGFYLTMSKEAAEAVSKLPGVTSVEMFTSGKEYVATGGFSVYPHHPQLFPWNQDNYGPIVVPAKGMKVNLTAENIIMYKRCIETYEGNKLEIKGNEVFINGAKADSYTFQMDYYWAMGDNRHNSLDSRYFGFVPEDHVVGKASFVWYSSGPGGGYNSGIRWNRLFRGIGSLQD